MAGAQPRTSSRSLFNPLLLNLPQIGHAASPLNIPNDPQRGRQPCVAFGSVFFTPVTGTNNDLYEYAVRPLKVRASLWSENYSPSTPPKALT
jgi:hypothetical protein